MRRRLLRLYRWMKRRLLNRSTALSLLMCAAVVRLWVRSYLERDVLYLQFPSRRWLKVEPLRGVVKFASGHHPKAAMFGGWCMCRFRTGESVREGLLSFGPPAPFGVAYRAGEEVLLNDVWGGSSFLYSADVVVVRYWLVVLATAVLPATRVLGWARRRRCVKLGHCAS